MEIKTYNFVGIDATQAKGIEEVKEHTGIGIAPCGLTVEVKKEGVGIHLVPADGKIQITYGRDFEFYRALSQLNYVAESGRAIHETTFMSDLCFMADMSRNAVYNLPAAKKMIRYLALAGYSSLMFYTEDTFTVERPGIITEYQYEGIAWIKETSKYYMVFWNKSLAIPVEKAGFYRGKKETFGSFLEKRCNKVIEKVRNV